ncbi:MAG: hypothetical protein Q8O67_09260 [Deltaproteobacteria bacterium]|nr:hypothetical protein [Deltaproteobacteria bacterium]
MRSTQAAVVVVVVVVVSTLGCWELERDPQGAIEPPSECDAGDAAFVVDATLALLGHRPRSHTEVELGVQAIAASDRRTWALQLMEHPDFIERWTELVLDDLYVPRTGVQAMAECYGTALLPDPSAAGDVDLAVFVRDNAGIDAVASTTFTFLDLLKQSLVLDDLSGPYRAHLYALLTRLNGCTNVDPVEQELAFRDEIGHAFEASYLNRDPVCLACHTSSFAVTDDEDPALDRHWPLRGRFEDSVFGSGSIDDPRVPRAVFRVQGFVTPVTEEEPVPLPGSFSPWGADLVCGSFARDLGSDDPAAVDAHFAGVDGRRVSIIDLEASLKRGVDAIATNGLVIDADDAIADPDSAFAYLVAANIVDNTWREVVGSPLTIATHFPRNQSQRDVLQSLTDNFVASHFSLKQLLADVVTSGFINLQAPESACSDAFGYPPIFDAWTRDEPVPEARNNAASDAVHALSARTLLSASYAALGWPAPEAQAFPEAGLDAECFELFNSCTALEQACADGECCPERDASCAAIDGPLSETEVQQGIGVFHGISEKGFRGLDFQARLFFEARFGSCEKPAGVAADVVDDVVAASATATVEDLVLTLKERLTQDTSLDAGERALLEGLMGRALDRPAADVVDVEAKLRVLCGALLASPQFQLTGVASSSSPPAPFQPRVAEVCRAPLPGCE